MKTPPIVSPEAWEAARVELLMNEKAFTRARDRLAAERRQMPWMPVFRTGRALAADRLRSDYPGEDCGLETICARTAVAAVTSRSESVPGSPTPADANRRRAIWATCFGRSWLTIATVANHGRRRSTPRSGGELAD
jgi:hypothetical protein